MTPDEYEPATEDRSAEHNAVWMALCIIALIGFGLGFSYWGWG